MILKKYSIINYYNIEKIISLHIKLKILNQFKSIIIRKKKLVSLFNFQKTTHKKFILDTFVSKTF